MVFDKFIPEGAVFFLPETIPNWELLDTPVPARFYSAHFCFTLGSFAKEVQHNPDFYFHGEEISITVRAFTKGYDLFHPHRVVIWHEYTREGRTKQWDDDKEWYKKNENAHLLNRKLFGMDGLDQEGHEGKYGLGDVRTLRDYEEYAGLLFSKRAVQRYTLQKEYPPNPNYSTEKEFFESFAEFFEYEIKLNKNDFTSPDYEFWAVIFHNDQGEEIFRKDADPLEVQSVLSKEPITIKRSFLAYQTPKTWTVWGYTKSKGWDKEIKGII
jgi:hypothetical protein